MKREMRGSQKFLLAPGRKRINESMVSARNVTSSTLEAWLEAREHTVDSGARA